MNSNPLERQFPSPILVLIAAALLALALTGCKRGAAQSAPPPPPQVTVATVEEQEVVEWEELTGRTAAVEFVEVRPRVSGHITKVLFESGQVVKKGDVLFTIDPRWHKAICNQREAELAMAKVRLDNTEREAKRNAQLLASKAISKEEADGREARFAEARAASLAAEAARDTARLDLDHTEICAPINGRVSRALVTAGNYISGNAGAATLLTTIVSVDPIHVYADMDENALLRYNALSQSGTLATNGDGKVPVELQLADEDGYAHRGHVESLDNRLDAQTGSIVLRALFPNPNGRIVPGLFARIRLPASARAPMLLVDESAIGTDQAQKFVLTLTSTNTTAYRPVRLGSLINGKRVVREGLEAGEKIVVNGLARVRPGMSVTPLEAVATNGQPKVAKN
jgi:RND family efflux transporter MFP subunit